jgi:PAS domain-containing protein
VPTPRQLDQRTSIATLAVVGAAVAMLVLLVARTRSVAMLYAPAGRDLEQLVLLEVVCAVLLLAAIGLGVRLALRPAHVRFEQTAAALADHESRTRAVLDAMDEGTLLFARDGSLIDSNPSAERILGLAGLAPGLSMRVLAERS